jgi:glycosyltransferase involved in cell wall biosynthesis
VDQGIGRQVGENVIIEPLSCSVIVPCRNERGNIESLVRRLPSIGSHTELIFVDGASSDGTPDVIEQVLRAHPDKAIKLLRQTTSKGKAGAVFQGFDAAGGDILMILDADMTVAPEDLPLFYRGLARGETDFANGTRFAYPMQAGAMPRLNYFGNLVFSRSLSWLMGTRITDSLCGTKAFFKRDWPQIREKMALFGGHDPWGDFDLLLAARCVGLRIMDIPVQYWARTAGESKMRASHVLPLAWTCFEGYRRLKLRRG